MRWLPLCSTAAMALLGCGCRLTPFQTDGDCPDARRTASGICCPTWTIAGGGACERRPWTLPVEGSGLGEADVRSLNVAIDGRGQPIASWIEATESSGRVVVAEARGGAFEVRSPSEALGGTAVQSDVAAGVDGAAMVVWKQQYPGSEGRVFVSEREADGAWSDPAGDGGSFSRLPTAYEPRPRFFPNGERLVVWNQWMSTGYGVATATKPPGEDWHLPANADDVLSQHLLYSNAPQPAVNERGDAVISWYQSDGAALLAWESERFGYGGAFSRPGPTEYLSVRDAPIDSHPIANPKPALSPAGEAAVVWTQENGKGSTLVYIATRTPAGVWTKPASLDDALSPRLGYARCPQVAFAPTGDLFVVWYQDIGNGNRVLAAHRAPDGQWVEPGREPTLVSTEGRDAIFPALAIGGGGAVLATWSERQADRWVVAARRRAPSGSGWGPVEVLSVTGTGDASQPAAAIGGEAEVAIVGWTQSEGAVERAYFATVPSP